MKRTIRIIKNIISAFIIIVVILAIAGSILFYYYQDEIREIAVIELNKQLNAEIAVDNIELSLFKDFPFVSLRLENVTIQDPIDHKKQLLSASLVSLKFNIYKLVQKEYHLTSASINDGSLNLVKYDTNRPNYQIWQVNSPDQNTSFYIDLQSVNLKEMNVSYAELVSNDFIQIEVNDAILKGALSSRSYVLSLQGDVIVQNIRSGKDSFVSNKVAKLKVRVEVDQDEKKLTIKDGIINTNDLDFILSGTIDYLNAMKQLDIYFDCVESDLSYYTRNIPSQYTEFINDYTYKGNLDLNGRIFGKYGSGSQPSVVLDFIFDQGSVIYKKRSLSLSNISFKGMYRKQSGLDELSLNEVSAQLGQGSVSGRFNIVGFIKPKLELETHADFDLAELFEFFPMDTLSHIKGRTIMDIYFKGNLSGFRQFAPADFLKSRFNGSMEIENGSFAFKNSISEYSGINASLQFNNDLVEVKSFTANYSNSDLSVGGIIINLLPFLFIPGEQLIVDADFDSKVLDFDELLQTDSKTKDTSYFLSFPKWLRFNLELNIDQMKFRKFNASNISGKVELYNNQLFVSPLRLNTMNGLIIADGKIDNRDPNHLDVQCRTNIKNVNIRNLFYSFENFRQRNLQDKNIKGTVNSDVFFKASFSPELVMDKSSIYANAFVSIENGELIYYTPLMKLSRFVRLEDLEHIKFSRLTNRIEINDQRIKIPEMEIESSTLDLTAFGTHTFDNEIDYRISILLSELLSAKFKNRNKESDFGLIEDDGLGRTKVFILLSGTANDPIVKYDKTSLKEKLSDDLFDAGQELKSVLKDEFDWLLKDSITKEQERKDRENLQRQENGEFIIEWEEDEIPDTIDIDKPKKKIKGSKFKVEWDEDSTKVVGHL